ncbi:hypothetical protein CC1G_05978 [Coprinopsis cinerea okayama7|uniref:DUF6589 domain-containing protein n=1 Tax=Coprinopsis cinerea (strain Okayama-7 / 130 / ATCC MYA-4618 / FGSC 9003) TaxID=240176 RepID=A8N4K0_COPC7|nr:hypothetical protein CC1G_05978 [Coprinopsis cinerea okayama7\|eukprot:XP_001829769.2 hypothetical protein CC1G_05978 [Coprinopsis cinerea okayama7\
MAARSQSFPPYPYSTQLSSPQMHQPATSSTVRGDEGEWEDLYTIDSDDFEDDPTPKVDFLTLLTRHAPRGNIPSQPATPVKPKEPQPIESSSGPVWSSPITGNREQRREKRFQKNQRRKAQQQREQKQARQRAREETVHTLIVQAMGFLKGKGVGLKDILGYIFDPAQGQRALRWKEYFAVPGTASQLLGWFASSEYPDSVRQEVHQWAVTYISSLIAKEARQITESGVLNSTRHPVTAQSVASFDFGAWYEDLAYETAPTAMAMFKAFATSRHVSTHSESRRARTRMVVTSVALACLGEYSRANNLVKRQFTLYLYSTGAQRQTISVLSRVGVCGSYTNLISSRARKKRNSKKADSNSPQTDNDGSAATSSNPLPNPVSTNPDPEVLYEGTLPQLSHSIRTCSRELAATGTAGLILDNINMAFMVGEQVLGRHDSQENGTCATLFPLYQTTVEDLDVEKLRTSFLNARDLQFSDLLFNPDEHQLFRDALIHTILRIIIRYGGPGFKHFENEVENNQPTSAHKIDLHKTELYPLPAMNIDQSSITGNADVDEAIVKELRLDQHPDFLKRARVIIGDQLTVARFRSLETIRAGHETDYEGFFWGVWVPGLFHTKIADAHGVLLTHFGKPSSGSRNPGSLSFHNTVLDRLPITLNSKSAPPKFRIARDLIFTSLYARVLHCLLCVSGAGSLDDYLAKFTTYEDLSKHASEILDQFASRDVVQSMRWKRKVTGDPNEGDMVFENAILFLADALVSREFTDAIKAGDSGRIFLVLKHFAFSFRGNGRLKYAYEMLYIIHNLSSVLPESMRRCVMNNWVLNPSGNPNSWVEGDLVQEHSNLKIKGGYKARGSNASWDWLALIAPCTEALRELANNMHSALGHDQGTKHSDAKLDADIRALMDSLDEHSVYRMQPGRVLDEDDPPVPDVVSVGSEELVSQSNSPLTEFNAAFRMLKRHRQMQPVPDLEDPDDHGVSIATPVLAATDPEAALPTPGSQSPDTNGNLDDEDEDIPTYEELERVLEPELVRIMREVREGLDEAALPRVADDDVAYDMDNIGGDMDSESSDSDDTDSVDEVPDDILFMEATGEEGSL